MGLLSRVAQGPNLQDHNCGTEDEEKDDEREELGCPGEDIVHAMNQDRDDKSLPEEAIALFDRVPQRLIDVEPKNP